jgi:hypothetical protein
LELSQHWSLHSASGQAICEALFAEIAVRLQHLP